MTQNQNGLRRNDFARYRQYCSRRLRRLRTAKAVKFTHSTGTGKNSTKKYVPKELTPDTVKDVRHLMIPLYEAERAWAMSQELQALESTGTHIGIRYAHLKHRLAKAVEWSELLEKLCTTKADTRTLLEAEAYNCWLKGTYHAFLRNWEIALPNLSRARAIYDELGKVTTRRTKELYFARSEEIEPTERFCRYYLSRLTGKKGDKSATTDTNSSSGDLRSKIDAAVAEQRTTRGNGVSAIMWRKSLITVKSEKVRNALGNAQEKANQLEETMSEATNEKDTTSGTKASSTSNSESLYLDVLSRYDEVARIATAESSRCTKEGLDSLASDYTAISNYAKFMRLRLSLDRGLVNISEDVHNFHVLEHGGKVNTSTDKSGLFSPVSKTNGKQKKKSNGNDNTATEASVNLSIESAWADSPLHQAINKSSLTDLTGPGTSSTTTTVVPSSTPSSPLTTGTTIVDSSTNSIAASTSAVVTAANKVTGMYARLLRVVDDMILLSGGIPPSTGSTNTIGSSILTTTTTASTASNTNAASSSSAELAVDTELLAALMARRDYLLAWRSWYAALAYLVGKRFMDAASLLQRARARTNAAIESYKLIPESNNGKALPPLSVFAGTGTETVIIPEHFALSGVSGQQLISLNTLVDAIATRSVAITATGLLETLAPSIRLDTDITNMYVSGLLPLSHPEDGDGTDPLPNRLIRSNRLAWLTERITPYSALEAIGDNQDTLAIGKILPTPSLLPLPVKPILFDLAFNGVDYPEAVLSAPTAAVTNSKGAQPPNAPNGTGSTGVLSWIMGGNK